MIYFVYLLIYLVIIKPSIIILAALICQEDTDKNQGTTCIGHSGHRLVEEDGTANHCGNRNQIDIIGAGDGT